MLPKITNQARFIKEERLCLPSKSNEFFFEQLIVFSLLFRLFNPFYAINTTIYFINKWFVRLC